MPFFVATDSFQMLLDNFNKCIDLARQMDSPNREDDMPIKLAIVGFSYESATMKWGTNHFRFVSKKRAEYLLHDPDVSTIETARIECYGCLCLGYLLGLFQEDKISENEFMNAEAQLQGFILLHFKRIADVG